MSLLVEVKEDKLMSFIKGIVVNNIILATGKSTLENDLVKISIDKIEEVK